MFTCNIYIEIPFLSSQWGSIHSKCYKIDATVQLYVRSSVPRDPATFWNIPSLLSVQRVVEPNSDVA